METAEVSASVSYWYQTLEDKTTKDLEAANVAIGAILRERDNAKKFVDDHFVFVTVGDKK